MTRSQIGLLSSQLLSSATEYCIPRAQPPPPLTPPPTSHNAPYLYPQMSGHADLQCDLQTLFCKICDFCFEVFCCEAVLSLCFPLLGLYYTLYSFQGLKLGLRKMTNIRSEVYSLQCCVWGVVVDDNVIFEVEGALLETFPPTPILSAK